MGRILVSDIVLQKHKLDSFYIISQLPNHYNLKDPILNSIDKFKQGNLHNIDSFYFDRITKLDWDNSKDLTREWTLLIYDTINSYFSLTAEHMGYKSSVYMIYGFNNTIIWTHMVGTLMEIILRLYII
jgi:hypothetical protein